VTPGSGSSPATPSGASRRPLRIGLSANLLGPDADRRFYPHSWLLYAEEWMVHMLTSVGVLAYVVPPPSASPDALSLGDIVADLDGVVLTGGADVAPSTYGQEALRPEWAGQAERDRYEITLVQAALDAGLPVLGICRGMQLLNVALGGTLWQDITEQTGSPREHRSQERYHRNRHEVDIVEGSGLSACFGGRTRGSVISVHHQAVRDLAPGLVAEAHSSDDGIVEAVRLQGSAGGASRWAVGVQWHPEFEGLAAVDSTPADDMLGPGPLLDEFLAAAIAARGRRIAPGPHTGEAP
jgi:putative glutamine amidotransferase